MTTKACSQCRETKPLTEFHVDRSKPDGVRHMCKVCACAYQEHRNRLSREEMNSRLRTLINIATDAGLDVLRHYHKPGRVWIDVRAPNGVKSSFAMRDKAGRDVHADLHDAACVKRFARENTPQTEHETLTQQESTTLKTDTASTAAEQLTMREFYQLCEWLKSNGLVAFPNVEALALAATDKIGQPVSEATVREVMAATETAEPDHWHPLPAADVVLVREIGSLLKALGTKPSNDFTRLAALMGVV